MTNDSFPFPSPSKAPDTVTETDDTINPILMSLSASLPSRIVSGFPVNRPISACGTAHTENRTDHHHYYDQEQC